MLGLRDGRAPLSGFRTQRRRPRDRFEPEFCQWIRESRAHSAYLNRPEEAILSAQQAMRLSPLDPGMFAFYSALALAHLALGRYEEGLRWAEESLRANIGIPGLRQKLSLCGHLGRRDAAEECLRQLREIHPEVTIAGISRGLPKGYSPELTAHFLKGLRKAGVPEA